MTLQTFFNEVGGNYEEVLSRLPTEGLIHKFLGKFPDDPSYAELNAALEGGDFPTAFRAAHTLKGVACNLGLTHLTEAVSTLTEFLRHAETAPPTSMVNAVEEAYKTAVQMIHQLKSAES